jgi:aryl-alcohol dehydrogenase-like predicted oxidoreductase
MQETAMLSKVKIADTDLMVSRLCYGTNMLGTAIDQAGANAILDHFAELGGT